MKKAIAKMSELQKMLLLAGLVSVVLIGVSCIGLAFNQPGWLIGVSIGSCIEIINIILLYKGSSEILKNEKPGLFILFYMLRMVLFVGTIIGLVVLQYKANIEVFTNSFWGALIGYTPMQLVVIIVTILNSRKDKVKGNE